MAVRRSLLMTVVAVGYGVLAATQVWAQSYPQRTIRVVVDRPAGVPHDILARAMSDKLSASLKQTVIVDNRVGAGGNLAAEFVARPNSARVEVVFPANEPAPRDAATADRTAAIV